MSRPQKTIFVSKNPTGRSGNTYLVTEKPGYLKADLHGQFGWTSVWADTYTNLVRRIRQARNGGQ